MNPHEVWCPNMDCPARGQAGMGNSGVHRKKERRYRCSVCDRTLFRSMMAARLMRIWLGSEQVIGLYDYVV